MHLFSYFFNKPLGVPNPAFSDAANSSFHVYVSTVSSGSGDVFFLTLGSLFIAIPKFIHLSSGNDYRHPVISC